MSTMWLILPFLVVGAVYAAPPASRRSDQVDVLHGEKVEDPYRWLEDVDSAETRTWVQQQVAYTRQHLDKIPGREAIRKTQAGLLDYTRYPSGLIKRGNRLFYQQQAPGQNQPVLMVREGNGAARELLNPNTLSKEGTVAVAQWAPSEDGNRLAYAIARSGSDWMDYFVRDVATGKDLEDKVEWVKFSAATWAPDHSGFYYATYPRPEKGKELTAENYFNKLYFHKLGTPQTADRLVYERPDQKEWSFGAYPSDDGRYLLLFISHGTRVEQLVSYQDLQKPGVTKELIREFTGVFSPLGNTGSTFYFFTTHKSPKGRVVAISLDQPEESAWRTVVAEGKDVLEDVVWSGNRLICSYMEDVKSAVRIYTLEGKRERDVQLPGVGVAHWMPGKRTEVEQYYSFMSFTQPLTTYRYDLAKGASTPVLQSKLPFDTSHLETTQVFYTSKDGTRVPMFVTARKGVKRNGQNPVLLYGYGGFGVSLRPGFSALYLGWLEQGGIVAVANLRGGNEYGEEWHKAGMLQNKQNVFDDFIAAAEYLIAQKYTSKQKLAIFGGSNGGLLVGACLNQRPDLFGAAIPAVGVMDMLRYHKFTIGRAWASDYGSPDDAKYFTVLKKYSPLQNIRKGTVYPPVMVMTADHDDRVVPAHSFKYAAQLQYAQEGKAPILIRIETNAGHSAGKPTSKVIEESTDMILFLREALKM